MAFLKIADQLVSVDLFLSHEMGFVLKCNWSFHFSHVDMLIIETIASIFLLPYVIF